MIFSASKARPFQAAKGEQRIVEIPRATAYRLVHRAHSAWTRRRYGAVFNHIERFCLFVGYPRSGHSIVGAMVNAHKDAVISHELIVPPLILNGCSRNDIYSQIIARANWFNMRGNTTNYRYRVPGQWQGKFETLRVIGDKRGGSVTCSISEHPDFLERVRTLFGIPLRLIHVVRNPYDNIAAISIWHRMPLKESIDYYFLHCRTTSMLKDITEPGEVISIRHEEMISNPRKILTDLCTHLGLQIYPGYLDDCCAVLFDKPTFTRQKVNWEQELVDDVANRAAEFPLLSGYRFGLINRKTRYE